MALKDKLKNAIDGAANQAFFGATLGIPYDLAPGIRKLRNFVQTRQLPNNGGSYQSPTVGQAPAPATPKMPQDFQGLYGTNQNYEGAGGFNYATQQVADNAKLQQSTQDSSLVDSNYTETPGSAQTMDAMNTIGNFFNGKSPEELAQLRQKLAYEQGLAQVGLLPGQMSSQLEAIKEATGDEPVFNYDQLMKLNDSFGSIYNPELESLDAQIKAQKDGGSGLTPQQINATVNGIAGQFDNEPLVKEFNTANSYVKTYKKLGDSATDDQARIYTFAKVMDPSGSVKEGEYKTVEQYSQALLSRAGISVKRVFTNTGALTPEARTAMGSTLDKKLQTSKEAFDNLRKEYQRQMDDAYAEIEH